MNALLKDVLERAKQWPPEAQKELAEIALEMESIIHGKPYRASAEELQAIDEAERSGVASPAEVEAAFAAFRRK
jgi:pseudouridine-5'-phosphate glycosidase